MSPLLLETRSAQVIRQPKVQGLIISAVVLALASIIGIASLLRPAPFWDAVWEEPYKAAFVVGMLASLWAQTAVATFLHNNRLLDCVPVWEHLAPASNLGLAGLALLAIVTTGSWLHIWFAVAYLVCVAALDLWVMRKARKALGILKSLPPTVTQRQITRAERLQIARHSNVCRRICSSIFCKLDLVSAGGVLILAVLAVGLGRTFGADPPVDPNANAAAEAAHHAFRQMEVATHPDLFLSGAIGFHLLFTLFLIMNLLNDWTRELKRRGYHP